MKKNNSWLWIIPIVILMVLIVSVCRRQTVKTPSANSEERAASDNSNLLLGNPTDAVHSSSNSDNYLIDHKYYVESYNSTTNIPNWVSWHVGASDLGTIDRLDNFRQDNNLPGGWYTVSPNNYKGSGFDKGHCCPSGDRTNTQEANSATFLMDNIIPQAPRNNEQTWEHFESYCRDKVKAGNEVYIIMGSYGVGGTGSKGYRKNIGYGKVIVPAHVWKIAVILPDGNNDLARINDKTHIIAIDTPNDNAISTNWMNYITTVNDIQDNCSCDLLSALPKAIQMEVEKKKFAGGD